MSKKEFIIIGLFTFLFSLESFAQDSYWKRIEKEDNSNLLKSINLDHENYRLDYLNFDAFKLILKNVPLRTQSFSKSTTFISLPVEDSSFETFRIQEAPVLSLELSKKYPNIKTYVGYSMERPGVRARFSVTPQGLQTMISFPRKATVFTVPVKKGNTTNYITYTKNSKLSGQKDFQCFTEDELVTIDDKLKINKDANDQVLRTFRIAVSTNGEYTNHWDDGNASNGNAQEDAFAQVVATLNRTNEVFEVDMAVTFTLVTGTELIYPNPSSDPYTGSYNSQIQNTLTNVVGEPNYDIGHLFAKDSKGGSAGCIGCVCVNGQKGSGYSAHDFRDNDGGPYMSDFFDIDYVPHEIGHQMGANHTFSHRSEGTGVNVEPGSGTTIMGYAGITGSNDVQDHSDPYFHYHSIRQILNNLQSRTCWTPTNITNNPPVADAGSDYTIPAGTAFVLTGSVTDNDNSDTHTYTWEQIDNGVTTSANFGPTKTSGGIFRSRPPSSNPSRYFPVMSRILNGQLTETNPVESVDNTTWETVPIVSRDLNFALTVRDRSEVNGTGQFPQSDFDLMRVTVDDSAGPFVVTSQSTNEVWNVGSNQTVTWNVANTDSGNVNVSSVDILLSTNGGVSFDDVVVSNTPNDGSHRFEIPSLGLTSNQMRLMVKANNHIFFAVNESNFTLEEPEFSFGLDESVVNVCKPDNGVFTFRYNANGFSGNTTFSTSGLPSGLNASFSPASTNSDDTQVTLTITGIDNIATGTYDFQIVGNSGSISNSETASLGIFNNILNSTNLLMPTDNESGLPLEPTLEWQSDTNATSYNLQVSRDNAFSNLIVDINTLSNSYVFSSDLDQATTYYWRVKPRNICGEGNFSSEYSFTTQSCSTCVTFGDLNFETSVTRVMFNTIDNSSSLAPDFKTQGYTDYTSISTNVKKEAEYDLTVNVNTDGDYTIHTIAWIDWNQDCVFDDATEKYDLGVAENVFDQPSSASPLTIVIPANARLGSTKMRVSTRFSIDPVPCQELFDGEAEDYTIVVEEETASIQDTAFEGFNMYPNPTQDNFNLRFKTITNDAVNIRIIDLSGRTILQKEYKNPGTKFAENIVLNRVASGIYLVQIRNGNKQTTRKLIIE